MIKREAENKIRVLQNLTSTIKDQPKYARNPLGSNSANKNNEMSFIEEPQKKNEKTKKKRNLSNFNKKVGELEDISFVKETLQQPVMMINGEIDTNCRNMLEFLKENLNESLEREKKLLEKIDKILLTEARKMADKTEELKRREIALRPEVERW